MLLIVPQLRERGAVPPIPIRFGSMVFNLAQGNSTLTVHNSLVSAKCIIILCHQLCSEILLLVVVSKIIREVRIKIIFINLSRIYSFANVTQKYLAGSTRRLIYFGTKFSASGIAVVLSALRRTDDFFLDTLTSQH